MQAAHRVAKNTGILYVRMAITVFLSLYATRLVLAALGVADFGLFNVVGGLVAMLGFLNSSMAGATQRFMSFAQGEGDLEKVKRIFNISTVLHAGIAVLIVLVLEIAGYFFFNGILNIAPERVEVAKIIYHFMVVNTFFTVLSVPYEAVITSHENMLFYAIFGVLESLLKLVIALYLAYSTYDHLIAYGFLMASLSIFLLIIKRIYCHWHYAECVLNFRKYYERNLMKEMTSFAGWSLLGSSTSMLANYGTSIVINIFFGTVVNAAQGIAAQVSGQLSAFATTMLKALNPIIDKSEGSGNRSLMLKATMSGSKISFFLLMFFYIPVLIEMPYIFKLWLKDVPEYAILFCRLGLIRNLIEQLFITLTSAIAAVGNIRKYQIYNSVLNFFPLVVSYILFLLHYPVYALYIVFIIYALIVGILVLYFAKSDCELSISVFLKNVVAPCAVSFAVIFNLSYIPFLFNFDQNLRLLLVISISSISFLITIWFIGFTSAERMLVEPLLRKLLHKRFFQGNKFR